MASDPASPTGTVELKHSTDLPANPFSHLVSQDVKVAIKDEPFPKAELLNPQPNIKLLPENIWKGLSMVFSVPYFQQSVLS